jgi:hypothetical protein
VNSLHACDFLKHRHFTASQYFLPIKRNGPGFRTRNTVDVPLLFGPSKNSQIAISDAILY